MGLIFGFFIYETINESNKLFGLSLSPYLAFAIVPAVFSLCLSRIRYQEIESL